MAALLGAFLLWLFATGEYSAWVALLSEPLKKVVVTADNSVPSQNTASSGNNSASSNSSINTITDWVDKIYTSNSTQPGVSDSGSTSFDTSNIMSA